MSGPAIMFLTVVAIFGVILVVFLSDRMEKWAGRFYNRRSQGGQILLFIPFALLWIFFRLIDVFVFICALFTGYQVAVGVRNWWNRRPH